MSYTIGFQAKDQKAILATEAATANQAVAIVAALRRRVLHWAGQRPSFTSDLDPRTAQAGEQP